MEVSAAIIAQAPVRHGGPGLFCALDPIAALSRRSAGPGREAKIRFLLAASESSASGFLANSEGDREQALRDPHEPCGSLGEVLAGPHLALEGGDCRLDHQPGAARLLAGRDCQRCAHDLECRGDSLQPERLGVTSFVANSFRGCPIRR
jgi:hypothetical protein